MALPEPKHPPFLRTHQGSIGGLVKPMDRPWFYVGKFQVTYVRLDHLCQRQSYRNYSPKDANTATGPTYSAIQLMPRPQSGPGLVIGQCPECERIYWGEIV